MQDPQRDALADHLHHGLCASQLDVDTLVDLTKVPRATIRFLLGDLTLPMLPERVYLRGHLAVIARELGLDRDETLALFDASRPAEDDERVELGRPVFGTGSVALAAGLAAAGVLAVVLAFVSL